jgi:hypothetical protein
MFRGLYQAAHKEFLSTSMTCALRTNLPRKSSKTSTRVLTASGRWLVPGIIAK